MPQRPGDKNGAQQRLKVVDLAERLTAEHRAHLETSGLSEETIRKQRFRSLRKNADIKKLLNLRTSHDFGDAILFPYIDAEGNEVWWRVRPSKPRTFQKAGGKTHSAKYESPYKSQSQILVPQASRESGRIKDTSKTLLMMEGEKKTLKAAQHQDLHDCAVVGAPGVSCFHSKARRDAEGVKVFPEAFLEEVPLEGRKVVILFDGDIHTNPNVMREMRALAGMIVAAGGKPYWAAPPEDCEYKGIDDYAVAKGPQVITEVIQSAKPVHDPIDPTDADPPVHMVPGLKDAPIEKALRWPFGYTHSSHSGLWREGGDGKDPARIADRVPLLSRVLIDMHSREERMEVVFRRRGRWSRVACERAVLGQTNAIVSALRPLGVNVDSTNATDIIGFLTAFEELNEERLPRTSCTPRCGWHHVDGEKRFVAPGLVKNEDVVFDDSAGRDSIVRGLRVAKGAKLSEHKQALNDAWNASPVAAATICASLAVPLLRMLDAASFCFSLYGDSSRGKTSMAKIAASIYGDPRSESWVPSWNATQVSHEVRAHTLCDLPFFVDEVGSDDGRSREHTIYMLTNGVGRSRGNREGGLREQKHWRTIVVSTGEKSIVPESAATGAMVRVLELRVAGFGNLDAAQVDGVRSRAARHFGAVGAEWLTWLSNISDEDVRGLRALYRETIDEVRRGSPDGSLSARQAENIALLLITEELAQTVLDVGDGEAVRDLFFGRATSTESAVETASMRALDIMREWVASQAPAFPPIVVDHLDNGRRKTMSTNAHKVFGWRESQYTPGLGRSGTSQGTLDVVHFLPGELREYLETRGIGAKSVLMDWRDEGVSVCKRTQKSHRTTNQTSINGKEMRVVTLKLYGDSG